MLVSSHHKLDLLEAQPYEIDESLINKIESVDILTPAYGYGVDLRLD